MTCGECALAAAYNRKAFDTNYDGVNYRFMDHPENCGCTCQHELPVQWEKSYSCPRPYQKETP